MKKIITYLLLLLLISCNGQGKDDKLVNQDKKEQNGKRNTTSQTINFLDYKYQKGGYSVPDNLTGNLNPSYSYFDKDLGTFTVDYIGKTSEERNFWNVTNNTGFFNNNSPEKEGENSYRIHNILEKRKDDYYIFATFLDKSYIKNISSDGEFDIKNNAEQKIYLYQGNNKWKLLKSIQQKDIQQNDLNFYLSLLDIKEDKNLNKSKKSVDSIIFPNSSTWSSDCKTNKFIYFDLNINSVQFTIPDRFSMNAQLKKIDSNKYEFYFTDFPPLIPLPKEMKNWDDLDNKKAVGYFEIIDDSKINLTWFGFYYKKTKKYIQTQNPFSKDMKTSILIKCAD